MNESPLHALPFPLSLDGERETMMQVANLLQKKLALQAQISLDGFSFRLSSETKKEGIQYLSGERIEDSVLRLYVELVHTAPGLRIPFHAIFTTLAEIGDKCRLALPISQGNGEISYGVEIRLQATPLSMVRQAALLAMLDKLETLAQQLQTAMPCPLSYPQLLDQYRNINEILEPIFPWPDTTLEQWARHILDLLSSSFSVAMVSVFPLDQQFALASLSQVSLAAGRSLGRLLPPGISVKALLDLVDHAPGFVVVPAISLSLGIPAYERGSEISALLASLTQAGRPAIFTGTMEELQSVFQGGQGGRNDPLSPIVQHVPDLALSVVTRFAMHLAGRRRGGLATTTIDELTQHVLQALESKNYLEQRRILLGVTTSVVEARIKGRSLAVSSTQALADHLGSLGETLSGLSDKPRARRSLRVQAHWTATLSDRGLISYLQKHLLAQDRALEELVDRLSMECLTRPDHQPLRYLAEGTPGTGKSESAALLAARLGVPHVPVDAASMPDVYTATAQLLGSGRGIVGSYQSGRLEQIAKHHGGAIVEVSDLDHAPANVRAALTDLFLLILETGEAQSAQGALFSCAELLFAFTINLPYGLDETLHTPLGFGHPPSRSTLRKKVSGEIQRMFSSAFLSRVGSPILFDPLDGQTLAIVAQRAVQTALQCAASRLQVMLGPLTVTEEVGAWLVATQQSNLASGGARVLVEHARLEVTKAFLALFRSRVAFAGVPLRLEVVSDQQLRLQPQ